MPQLANAASIDMGTSTDFPGSPKWGGVKRQVTVSAGGGHVNPAKIQQVLGAVVHQMQGATQGGFHTPTQDGGSRVSASARSNAGGGGRGGGGRRGSSSSRPVGIQGVAQSVGQFVSDVAQRGLRDALAGVGLASLEGKSPQDIALGLADALGGPASTIDQVDLRSALSDLIEEMLGDASTFAELESALGAAASDVNRILMSLFGKYIYHRFCSTMYKGLAERHGFDVARGYLGEIRDYIQSKLALETSSRDVTSIDWRGASGAQVVHSILDETLVVFGGA